MLCSKFELIPISVVAILKNEPKSRKIPVLQEHKKFKKTR